jgi:hypothetical protein
MRAALRRTALVAPQRSNQLTTAAQDDHNGSLSGAGRDLARALDRQLPCEHRIRERN